jgi:dolichyl-diphosphooligosaccharide---protein glycosyltransferase
VHLFSFYLFIFIQQQYLYWNGADRFFRWFDKTVWYPLGRPVGTTIYPGMQFTAVWIKRYLLHDRMSLNDICCYIPAWFGVLATIITGLIAYECTLSANSRLTVYHYLKDIVTGTKSQPEDRKKTISASNWIESPAAECGVAAAFMMGIVPAHLMRSMGGYDNESIAVTAMVLTFYFWIRSLRGGGASALSFGALTGLAYFYMVAAWGGYVFVLNLIGVHAAVLVALGRFSDNVYASYTLFYIVGTALAVQVPVVGWAPLKSLEQLGPCAVFVGYQLLYVTERLVKGRNLPRTHAWTLRIQVLAISGAALLAAAFLLAPKGYFGPISSRVRGLFVQHTKTGNPLVDSVAEHQPASNRAYFQYLHHVCAVAPIGYLLIFVNMSDSNTFLLVWGSAAYFFSHKMVRLILLTAPIGSILGGIAVGRVLSWSMRQLWGQDDSNGEDELETSESTPNGRVAMKKRKVPTKRSDHSSFEGLQGLKEAVNKFSKSAEGVIIKRIVAVIFFVVAFVVGRSFTTYCWRLSHDLSNPTIIMKGQMRDGTIVTVDDYREAYFWLRDNTPKDARIMAWWDCKCWMTEAKIDTLRDFSDRTCLFLGVLDRWLSNLSNRKPNNSC